MSVGDPQSIKEILKVFLPPSNNIPSRGQHLPTSTINSVDVELLSPHEFVFLTYILGLGWLGIFGFSAVPVFLFYNMWTTCGAMKSPIANLTSVDNICVDVRQYGIIPWNANPGKACGSTLSDICNTSEFYLSYHLYIVACAGAGATVIALIHYLMILAANWAYLKGACQQTHAYQDIKTRDDQELQDVQSRSKEGLNSYS
ncbi:neuronal membrane glycoprotein M6-b-like [Danio aesculapii]|uniref:neuronal membrane glycoprotein M6-b-like n=1 Tax=Danio aesculapii TaxID=1142201 RepID=UPI0024BF3279|nr:neuronal membrane glycoprotein M6-b-like [Danio aesculapii]